MAHPTVLLHNGVEMPALGFGTWELRNGRRTREAVAAALAAGYRHIDTAAMYGNEESVGEAVRASGLARGDVFVTTKIWNDQHGYERSRRALDRSRAELRLDPIDLFLIHWPGGRDRHETWRRLEEHLDAGTVRAIGVSNYDVGDLDEMMAVSQVIPMVNQIELNPFVFRRRRPTLDRCAELGIVVTAWRPLTKGRSLDHPLIADVAQRHGRTPAQVLLRWSIQHGIVPLPKSSRPDRIASNADVFDFDLSEAEMAAIDGLG
jgi:diketogulonate reductase-like aldo/keto reductase